MTLGLTTLRHRWRFVEDADLQAAAAASARQDAAGAALAKIGLQDRISAALLGATAHSERKRRGEDRPYLLAAHAGTGIAPQLLEAFPPAWQTLATTSEWQLARALMPADDNTARVLFAAVDAPGNLELQLRLSHYQATAIADEQRLLLMAPINGTTWREWHLDLPAADNLQLDQLLRQPLIIDWRHEEKQGRIVLDLYRDFPFLEQ